MYQIPAGWLQKFEIYCWYKSSFFNFKTFFFSVSCDWLDQDTTLPDEMFVPEYKSKVSATIGSWGWPLRF